MARENATDMLVRIRFLAVCMGILFSFWGLVRMGTADEQRSYFVWTSPDPETSAMLLRMIASSERADPSSMDN